MTYIIKKKLTYDQPTLWIQISLEGQSHDVLCTWTVTLLFQLQNRIQNCDSSLCCFLEILNEYKLIVIKESKSLILVYVLFFHLY